MSAFARRRDAVARRLRSVSERLGDADLAGDTIWGLVFEAAMVISVTVSFFLLGRNLGSEGYGAYVGLYAIIAPLGALASSGMALSVLQHAIRDEERLATVTRSALTLTLGLGALLTVIGTLIGDRIVSTLSVPVILGVMAAEFIAFPIVGIIATSAQVGLGYADMVKIKLLPPILRVVGMTALAAAGALTIGTLGASYLAINVVIALGLMRAMTPRLGFPVRPGGVRWTHLRSSTVYSAGITSSSLSQDGDKLVLAANDYVADNGLYGAAYRIILLGSVPINSFVHVTHQRLLVRDDEGSGTHLKQSMRFTAVASGYALLFAAAVWLVAPLLPIVLGDDFAGSVQMLRWLTPLVVLRVLISFPQNGMLGLGYTGLRTGLLAITAALSMTSFILLVPSLSWRGALIGNIVVQSVMVVVSWGVLLHLQRRHDRTATPDRPAGGGDDDTSEVLIPGG